MRRMGLQKGSVLISGASSGIGRATALLLAEKGYQVFAGVRSVEVGSELKQILPQRIEPVLLDVTKADQIETTFQQVVANESVRKEGLVALVNNAGTVISGPLEFLMVEDLRRQFEINLFGHLAVIQKFLPLVRQARGRIINVGSTAAFFAAPFLGAYCASKHAMEAFTDSLRRELQWEGIHVSIVEPGYTETPIWDKGYSFAEKILGSEKSSLAERYRRAYQRGKAFLDRGRRTAMPPTRIAQCVALAIESAKPKRRYLVGVDTHVLFWAKRFLPDGLPDWFIKKVIFR